VVLVLLGEGRIAVEPEDGSLAQDISIVTMKRKKI
jgi:hypothetical protein